MSVPNPMERKFCRQTTRLEFEEVGGGIQIKVSHQNWSPKHNRRVIEWLYEVAATVRGPIILTYPGGDLLSLLEAQWEK